MSTKNASTGNKTLKLCSPAGAPVATYKWPLIKKESVNEATEIVETIEWVARDFPEVHYAVDAFVASELDTNSFDSMKQLCDKYNRAITNIRRLWSGRQPPLCIGSAPCPALLKHIMTQVYNCAIDNAESLNHYEPFSPEVYGETSYDLVEQMLKEVNITENDVFLDLGSGVGNVVLQVAGAAVPKECIGIEKSDKPARYAQEMEKHYLKWMKWYGKCCADFELIKGDFLSPEFSAVINKATIIFVNNFAFGPVLNHKLKLQFQNLADGVKIVSSAEFCSLNFRISDRNLGDIGAMMNVHLVSPLKGQVSWTNKPVNFYLQVIDRTLLEKYFHYKNHPDQEPPEELRRKLFPKENQDVSAAAGGDEEGGEGKSTPNESSCSVSTTTGSKLKPVKWSPAVKNQLLQQFSERMASQVTSFMSHLTAASQQPKLRKMIQSEKARREHLLTIVRSLEDEVTQLRSSSVGSIETCMDRLHMSPATPDVLSKGEKNIANKNRRLRRDMNRLETDVASLQRQVDTKCRLLQKNGVHLPPERFLLKQCAQKEPSSLPAATQLGHPTSSHTSSEPVSSSSVNSRKSPGISLPSTSHSGGSPITGLEQLLRVSELELLKAEGDTTPRLSPDRETPSTQESTHPENTLTFLQRSEQSSDEVVAAEMLSSLASFGTGGVISKPHPLVSVSKKKDSNEVKSNGSITTHINRGNRNSCDSRAGQDKSNKSSGHVCDSSAAASTMAVSELSSLVPSSGGHLAGDGSLGNGLSVGSILRVPDHQVLGEGQEERQFRQNIEKVFAGAKQDGLATQKAFSKYTASAHLINSPAAGSSSSASPSTMELAKHKTDSSDSSGDHHRHPPDQYSGSPASSRHLAVLPVQHSTTSSATTKPTTVSPMLMPPLAHKSPPFFLTFQQPPGSASFVETGKTGISSSSRSDPSSEPSTPSRSTDGYPTGTSNVSRKRHSLESRLSTSHKPSASAASEKGNDSPTPITPISETSHPTTMMGMGMPGVFPMLKPGDFPPLFPTFIPMGSGGVNGSPGGAMQSFLSSTTGLTSTASCTTTSNGGLMYAGTNAAQVSKTFSALDLQHVGSSDSNNQTSQKPSQFLPFFAPMMNYPGLSGSPTGVLPPTSNMLFPNPLLMAPHLSTQASSSGGQGQNWALHPGLSAPGVPFPMSHSPFAMMGLPSPQQLALMKSLGTGSGGGGGGGGGGKDSPSGSSTSPVGGLVGGSSQIQDVSPNGGGLPLPVFSPTFPGVPLMPSPLLMGNFATPTSQTTSLQQPSPSSGSSGGGLLSSGGGGSGRETQPRRKYQRRRPRQQQQQQPPDGLESSDKSDLSQKLSEGGKSSGQKQPAKRTAASKSRASTRVNPASPSPAVVGGGPAQLDTPRHGTTPPLANAADSHSTSSTGGGAGGKGRGGGTEVAGVESSDHTASEGERNQVVVGPVSSTPTPNSTDGSSVDTGFTSGHDDLDAGLTTLHIPSAESCTELSRPGAADLHETSAGGPETCSATSLIDASNLLSLSEPVTFKHCSNPDLAGPVDTVKRASEALSQTGQSTSLTASTTAVATSDYTETRKVRPSSMSAAEAMLMLNTTSGKSEEQSLVGTDVEKGVGREESAGTLLPKPTHPTSTQRHKSGSTSPPVHHTAVSSTHRKPSGQQLPTTDRFSSSREATETGEREPVVDVRRQPLLPTTKSSEQDAEGKTKTSGDSSRMSSVMEAQNNSVSMRIDSAQTAANHREIGVSSPLSEPLLSSQKRGYLKETSVEFTSSKEVLTVSKESRQDVLGQEQDCRQEQNDHMEEKGGEKRCKQTQGEKDTVSGENGEDEVAVKRLHADPTLHFVTPLSTNQLVQREDCAEVQVNPASSSDQPTEPTQTGPWPTQCERSSEVCAVQGEEDASFRKDSGSLFSPLSLPSPGSLVSTDTAAAKGECEGEESPLEAPQGELFTSLLQESASSRSTAGVDGSLNSAVVVTRSSRSSKRNMADCGSMSPGSCGQEERCTNGSSNFDVQPERIHSNCSDPFERSSRHPSNRVSPSIEEHCVPSEISLDCQSRDSIKRAHSQGWEAISKRSTHHRQYRRRHSEDNHSHEHLGDDGNDDGDVDCRGHDSKRRCLISNHYHDDRDKDHHQHSDRSQHHQRHLNASAENDEEDFHRSGLALDKNGASHYHHHHQSQKHSSESRYYSPSYSRQTKQSDTTNTSYRNGHRHGYREHEKWQNSKLHGRSNGSHHDSNVGLNGRKRTSDVRRDEQTAVPRQKRPSL